MKQTNPRLGPTTWASYLIQRILEYISSIWTFRNGVIHGHSLAEAQQKIMEGLQKDITTAYEAYQKDPFIVSHQLSSLFHKPLQILLKKDKDSLTCWLRTYEEAVLHQQEFRRCQSEAAKNFFIPKSKQNTSRHRHSKPLILDPLATAREDPSVLSSSVSQSTQGSNPAGMSDTDSLGSFHDSDGSFMETTPHLSDSLVHPDPTGDDSSLDSMLLTHGP
jgi:hypothetical protein